MNSVLPGQPMRVLSGMRPTGRLHLGHFHGVLRNWIELQHEYECFFFVADWHALATHYDEPEIIADSVWDMVIDWLAAGVDPQHAVVFLAYPGLLVRVSGYSAYFNDLTPDMKDEIISRTCISM